MRICIVLAIAVSASLANRYWPSSHRYNSELSVKNALTIEENSFALLSNSGIGKDFRSLIQNLRAVGVKVRVRGKVSQPFFSVKGRILTTNSEQIQVFEYAKTETAEEEAKKDFARWLWRGYEYANVDWTTAFLQKRQAHRTLRGSEFGNYQSCGKRTRATVRGEIGE